MNRSAYQFYQNCYNKLQEACIPLRNYLGIPHFGYMKIFFSNKDYFYFTNDQNITKEYLDRVTTSHIFFDQYLRTNDSQHLSAVLWPKSPLKDDISMQIYYNQGIWNGVSFFRNNDDSLEIWWFAGDADNKNINDFYISNLDVLEKFVIYFQNKLENICIKYDDSIFGSFKEFDFSLPNIQTHYANNVNIEKFLKDISRDKADFVANGKLIHLSKRELECLELLSKGCTLKIAAKELSLSQRTVETYINIVKGKMGYRYKSDLIRCFQDGAVTNHAFHCPPKGHLPKLELHNNLLFKCN